jgi:hypothetical protein
MSSYFLRPFFLSAVKTKILSLAILLMALLFPFLSWAQGKVHISGYVYEKASDTIRPVANINIINLRSFSGTVSSPSGFFDLAIRQGDTVLFTSIAHKTDTFIALPSETRSKLILTVVLKQQYHELLPVDVYGKDFEGFKHDFVFLDVEDTVVIRLAPQWKFQPMKQGFGVTINGPLTALWNVLSKQGRELGKLAVLLAEDEETRYLDSVYKRPVVLHFLELDEKEIEDLVKFCNFSKSYVAKSTDYELLLALERCYGAYKEGR